MNFKLDKLIENLTKTKLFQKTQEDDENDEDSINQVTKLFQEFNSSNSSTFLFGDFTPDESTKVFFSNFLIKNLDSAWSILKYCQNQALSLFITSCLDLIRLVSRDTTKICLFEQTDLLDLIQKISSLSIKNDQDDDIDDVENANRHETLHENLNLSALMSMSNLIYNSKFVQEFYVQNGVAEAATIFLKQLHLNEVLNNTNNGSDSPKQNIKLNTTIFKLRIMFLLSVFDKELRCKLREKLQVITYLIEIIDLVMKERLQLNESSQLTLNDNTNYNNNESTTTSSTTLDSCDYCYLKLVDIDFLNEILKILYNLTMDIAKPNLNFSSNTQLGVNNSQSFNNEEEEAHLMHLVSVLRDLMTCKLEQDSNGYQNFEKLSNLHSNIINLLTNMPSICFEELMTPCSSNSSSISSQTQLLTNSNNNNKHSAKFEQINNYYMNVRLAHNKKRQSRRSKRLRQKEENKKATKEHLEYENFFINSEEDFEFEGKNMEAVALVLSFMNRNVSNYIYKPSGSNADQIYPVLLLLSLMCKSNNIIRHYCRHKVLPPLKKKDLVNLPQSGSNIRNRLVRLMTDANIQVKRLGAQLLFILCKESVGRLIKYTGYGNAAGLLSEAGLMLSSHGDRSAYSSDSDNSDTDDYKQLENCINPVTGRAEIEDAQIDGNSKKYVRTKPKDIFEGISEEQKEYEAIQLANAIDKLTRMATGGIKPATIGPDGRVVELSHVLELQDKPLQKSIQQQMIANKKDDDDDDDLDQKDS